MSLTRSILERAQGSFGFCGETEVFWIWRVRLWDAMNREFPDSLNRRKLFAYAIAWRTYPEWVAVKAGVDPQLGEMPAIAFNSCKALLRGDLSEEQAPLQELRPWVERAMKLTPQIGTAAWVLPAAYAAMMNALDIEEETLQSVVYPRAWDLAYFDWFNEDADDWDGWDAHFWASCVAAGHPGLPGFDAEKRRKFWRRWLYEDMPIVIGPFSGMGALLSR